MKNYKHEMLKSIFGHLLDFLELHGISGFWPIFLLCAIVFIWVYKDCKKNALKKNAIRNIAVYRYYLLNL